MTYLLDFLRSCKQKEESEILSALAKQSNGKYSKRNKRKQEPTRSASEHDWLKRQHYFLDQSKSEVKENQKDSGYFLIPQCKLQ